MPEALRAGLPTHWTVFGDGARQVLALHCALAHGGAWSRLAGRLGPDIRLVAPDLPGHGRNPPFDPARGAYHDQATAMAGSFLEDGAADVIGHSFGGTVALRLAAERPGALRSLTLIEPVLFAAAIADAPTMARVHADGMAGFADALQAGDREAAARHFTGQWGAGQPWDQMSEAQRAAIVARIHLIREQQPALVDDVHGILENGKLGRIGCSVRIVTGANSPPIMAAIARALLARIPQARHVEIAGAGHMVPISHPAEVAEAIGPLIETRRSA